MHKLQLFGDKRGSSRQKKHVFWIYLGTSRYETQVFSDIADTSRYKLQLFDDKSGTSMHKTQVFWIYLGTSRP